MRMTKMPRSCKAPSRRTVAAMPLAVLPALLLLASTAHASREGAAIGEGVAMALVIAQWALAAAAILGAIGGIVFARRRKKSYAISTVLGIGMGVVGLCVLAIGGFILSQLWAMVEIILYSVWSLLSLLW